MVFDDMVLVYLINIGLWYELFVVAVVVVA